MAYYTDNEFNNDYQNTNNYSTQSPVYRPTSVQAPNYSQYQTGGSRIISYRAAGSSGKLAASVFSNVLMWLMIFGVGFVLFKFVWPLIQKWTHLLKPTASSTIDSANEAILKHSSDRMSNGSSYLEASRWLYSELVGSGWLSIFKNVDEDVVGKFMLTVRKEEFKQLQSTFDLYKEGSSWNPLSYASRNSLLDLLKDCFSKSEQQRYLSHLL